MEKAEGYFEIGIYSPRNWENIGTLWRSAWQLGAAGIFIIGPEPRHQSSDMLHVEHRIPLRHYHSFEEFLAVRPRGARLVGVEMGGEPLASFHHPDCALYLLGSESNGLPRAILEQCDFTVEIESLNYPSYNVAVSGTLVMYQRFIHTGIMSQDRPLSCP